MGFLAIQSIRGHFDRQCSPTAYPLSMVVDKLLAALGDELTDPEEGTVYCIYSHCSIYAK
jgi:hypothetical protein